MKPYLPFCVSTFMLLAMQGCSTTQSPINQPIILADHGQCTMLSDIDKRLCIATESYSSGEVTTTLLIQGAKHPLIESTTYLTPAHVIISPSGTYIALVESEEGHSLYAFYETKALLDGHSEVSPLMVLDDSNLAHIEFLKDNGDMAYVLTEGAFTSCQTYEVEVIEGRPRHTERCVIGFNLKTKQALYFELPYRCNI